MTINTQSGASPAGAVNAVDHYRKMINDNPCLSSSHVRVFEHWLTKTDAKSAYDLASVAFLDNGRYETLKRVHAL